MHSIRLTDWWKLESRPQFRHLAAGDCMARRWLFALACASIPLLPTFAGAGALDDFGNNLVQNFSDTARKGMDSVFQRVNQAIAGSSQSGGQAAGAPQSTNDVSNAPPPATGGISSSATGAVSKVGKEAFPSDSKGCPIRKDDPRKKGLKKGVCSR